jgi:uncharacterized hydrophobic protein (TIGR00271 family)
MRLHTLIHSLPAERQIEVLKELDAASSPGFDFFLMVILSSCIATFGLISNSAAVIIGAMLVAPLMSPILGLSLASVAGQQRMFRRAIVALIEGAILAVVLSASLAWLVGVLPFHLLDELPSEIIARTRPSPLDLGVALAGGAAAAYALAQPRLSAALPGVAIATALMPPLCTVGIGVSLANSEVSLGAALLFMTNLSAISFAGILVFAALGFRPLHLAYHDNHVPRSMLVSAGLVLIVTVPLFLFTLNIVSQANLSREVRQAVSTELATLPDIQLVSLDVQSQDNVLRLVLTIRTSLQPTYSQVVELQKAIAAQLQRPIALQLITVPARKLDPLVPPTFTPTSTPGPSQTPTLTHTPSPTLTPSPTVTTTLLPSVTPTASPTPTPTPTATPVLAYIATMSGSGVYLRDAPAGKVIGTIPKGAPVQILYRREMINNREWIEIQDVLGRIGWVQAIYLIIRP